MEITKEDTGKVTEQFIAARDYVRENEVYLRGRYQGRCMAILNRTVVDSDEDVMNLWQRVCKKPYEERNFDRFPVIGTVNSFVVDDVSILEEVLFGGIF